MGLLDRWMQPPSGGLLDPMSYNPKQEMMLAIAGQLLDNSGPSTTPRGFMQGVPQAILGSRQNSLQNRLRQLQFSDMEAQRAEKERLKGARAQFGAVMQPHYTRGSESEPWAVHSPDLNVARGLLADAYPEDAGKAYGNLLFPDKDAENYGQPQTVIGLDGAPRLVQFGNRGGTRPVNDYMPEPPKPPAGPNPFEVEDKLRDEHRGLSTAFITARDALENIEKGAAAENGPGDIALIFSFMKLMDPNSTVRESEYATVQNAGGIDERTRALWNAVRDGDVLDDETRKKFVSQARILASSRLETQQQYDLQYSDMAARNKANPRNVVTDYIGDLGPKLRPPTPPGAPPGTVFSGRFSADGKPLWRVPGKTALQVWED